MKYACRSDSSVNLGPVQYRALTPSLTCSWCCLGSVDRDVSGGRIDELEVFEGPKSGVGRGALPVTHCLQDAHQEVEI